MSKASQVLALLLGHYFDLSIAITCVFWRCLDPCPPSVGHQRACMIGYPHNQLGCMRLWWWLLWWLFEIVVGL